MGVDPGKVVKKELTTQYNEVKSKDDKNRNYDRFAFTKCRKIKPKVIWIGINTKSPNWQVGFFDADGEVYFNKIIMGECGNFSSVVRNYWWNGKEGQKKKEGYYSLIKQVKELQIEKKHVNDLLDYVEGRYETGEHWQLHELDRNIELKFFDELEETTVERLSRYFDNIYCDIIMAYLEIESSITYNCGGYSFKNFEQFVPDKLVIKATVKRIHFRDASNEVHIPEVVMEERADLKSIIKNSYGDNKYYSLLPHVQTLVIINNHNVLCDLADYIDERYEINDNRHRICCGFCDCNWQLHELNKNMKIMIEKPGIDFDVVKEIADYFVDVLVDDNKSEQYLARQQSYQKQFQEHFDKYDLETDQIGNLILAGKWRILQGRKFNVGGSNRRINELHVNQKIEQKQFVCFHETDEPVVIDKIVIEDDGDLRCVLQNAYYDGTDSGFFSLLRTAKQLEICIDQNRDNQVLADLADYIEGKYALNANWMLEKLDMDMKIEISSGKYNLSPSVAQRLRTYFINISIDCIYTPLETENIINQECRDKYIFTDSKEAIPQKLVINAKLIGWCSLILFNDVDGEVHIPEITIDEQGRFDSIVCNKWQNNKEGDEKRFGFYSLIQYVKTLTIRNNSGALKNLADYVVGKYEIENNNWESHWVLQQLSRNIKVVIESSEDAFLHVLKISKYLQFVTVDGKQVNDYIQTIKQEKSRNPDYRAFKTYFDVYGLLAKPLQYGIQFQKELQLVNCVYNIRKSMDSIDSLTVRQKMNINQFICFHDINKAVTVDKIIIDDVGDLRNVLQNAYYSNGQASFFSLLETAKKLEINDNKQAAEDLADYVDGKYTLHFKWERQMLDRDMEIKLRHDNYAFSLDVARRLRNYFGNVSIDCIYTLLETENIIDQECGNKYIFSNCRNMNPQKLIVNAKLAGDLSLIIFNDADGEIYIPEITIGEHGSFNAIVRNKWRNCKNGNKEKHGYYSLLSHVETLIIQNNPEALRDLDNNVSGNYKTKEYYWDVQKLSKNITVRINGVKGLDEQINRLKDYFGHIFINDRKALGNQLCEEIATIQLDDSKIQQQSTTNANKRNAIARADAEIAETRRRVERARARLGRRRARFQDYIVLTE